MKKLIVAITILTVALSSTVFATTTSSKSKQKLTVKDALASAMANSSELTRLKEDMDMNDESGKDAKEGLATSYTVQQYLSSAEALFRTELKAASLTNDEKLKKEKMEMSIIEYFSSIIRAEKELELYDKSLELAKKDMDILYVKYTLGLLSDADYASQKNAYSKKLADRELKLAAIDKAYISLNQLMARSLTNKYTLELNLTYSPIGSTSLTNYVSVASSASNEMKNRLDDYKMAEYKLSKYSASTSSESKETLEIRVNQAGRAISDTGASITEKITTFYNDIKTSEITYGTYEKDLKEMEKLLEIKTKQLELGKVTSLEVEKYKYEILKLKETIRQAAYDHEIRVMKLKNPVLITG